MKYHPVGRRGVALQIAHDRYRPGSVTDKFGDANRRTAFFCLIETAEGIENVEEIAAIDGVDCIWIGHFDLSVSLGIPGQFDNPVFTRAMDRAIAAAKASGKALGRLVPSVEAGIEASRQGFDFICYSAMSGSYTTRLPTRWASSAPVLRRLRWFTWPILSAWPSPGILGSRTARRPFRISTSPRSETHRVSTWPSSSAPIPSTPTSLPGSMR
jgi:hypothetical protein